MADDMNSSSRSPARRATSFSLSQVCRLLLRIPSLLFGCIRGSSPFGRATGSNRRSLLGFIWRGLSCFTMPRSRQHCNQEDLGLASLLDNDPAQQLPISMPDSPANSVGSNHIFPGSPESDSIFEIDHGISSDCELYPLDESNTSYTQTPMLPSPPNPVPCPPFSHTLNSGGSDQAGTSSGVNRRPAPLLIGPNGEISLKDIENSENYSRVIHQGPNRKVIHVYDDWVLVPVKNQPADATARGDILFEVPRALMPPSMRESIFEIGRANEPLVEPENHASDVNLSNCTACQLSLAGKDIHMYRGDAFCSSECHARFMIADNLLARVELKFEFESSDDE